MGKKSKRRLLREFLQQQKIPNLEAELALVGAAARANGYSPVHRTDLLKRCQSLQSQLDYQRHRLRMMDKAAARRQLRHTLAKTKSQDAYDLYEQTGDERLRTVI